MLKSVLNHTTQHVSLSDFYTRTMNQFLRTIEDAFVNREERSQTYINIDEDDENNVADESQVTIATNNNNIESDEADANSTFVGPSSNENAEQSEDDNDHDSDCEIVGVKKKKRRLMPFSVPRRASIGVATTLPAEIEIKDSRNPGKVYSVLNPKELSEEHKLLLSKRCTGFNEYVKKYLKRMNNEKTKTSGQTTMGKMGLKVISQCLICEKIVLDVSNMQKHIVKHSPEEKKAQKFKKSLTQDIMSNFVKQRAIPELEIYKVPSKKYGFLKQVSYHLDKWFIPFASVENVTYKAMHGHNKGYYKDPDKFSRAILNLKHEFQESIKKVLKDTL